MGKLAKLARKARKQGVDKPHVDRDEASQECPEDRKGLNLYHVQDGDRPMYVLAIDWKGAIDRWKARVGEEGGLNIEELDEPRGISMVADADDLLLPDQEKT